MRYIARTQDSKLNIILNNSKPKENVTEPPAASSGGQCEACCPTRPSGAKLLWSASRCLMGSHHPMTRKSEWWFLLPSRLCV